MSKRPIISFCIPTYNRVAYLEQALNSYVECKGFDDEVEIVISDNASTDGTREMCIKYTSNYPNIKYFRNDTNLRDSNFPLAINRSSGIYSKLMNDNMVIQGDAIEYVKKCVKDNMESHIPIFFTNHYLFNHKMVDKLLCKNFEEFVLYLSFYVTANMCFGAWREDWELVKDPIKYTKLRLNQDDWAYQIMEMRGKCILYNKRYTSSLTLDAQRRTGYNWFTVHVSNYYKILQPYVDKGLVSQSVLKTDKKTFLKGRRLQLIMAYIYKVQREWNFDTKGTTRILWNHFKTIPYFYYTMAMLPIWGGVAFLKMKRGQIIEKIKGRK